MIAGISTHTADGLKVGLAHREAGVPLICLEAALPQNSKQPFKKRPPGYENIEALPQWCEVMAQM